MRTNNLKKKWSEGKPAVMGWCSTGNPYLAEVLATIGYDAVVIDWQHGIGVTGSSVTACIQAIGNTSTTALVRVPKNEPDYISYVLDAGAYGVIVPMVNSFEEASAAGLSTKYAPEGTRSIAANRETLTATLDEYVVHANKEIICLVMIETVVALNNVEEIAQAPGIDGLYIGPNDLSLDMGVSLTKWASDPAHIEACKRVLNAANANGIIAGHHGAGPSEANKLVDLGFMVSQLGNDVRLIKAASTEGLKSYLDNLK
ncbi:2,4-dihydroxyhept-2-ene-1,7-dioic acid aldolase [SAR202 cluster bacterium AC-409-J13_OGT_754m]|nr:2,4-dihydroxyhept-2-ene-1,7-dioic acid aldolase [SAR202 cluster bacterium AC-409-J13_OGT_754m]